MTRQLRPDLMVNVSMASQFMGNPTVRDVTNLNKAVKMLKDSSEAKWCFRKSALTLEDSYVLVFADSSFASCEGLKSQSGYVVGLTSEDMKDIAVPVFLLETSSGSIKRVCRSTLSAEANGFVTGVEVAEYVRMMLMELNHPDERLKDLDREYSKKKVLCIMQGVSNAQAKEMIGENTFEDDAMTFAIWADTSQMLADVLTKIGCERGPLMETTASGRCKLEASEAAKTKKLLIRAGRHSRKAALKRAEDG